ncbi:MAG: prepilin-type N-terminal cleavage/methylation domain-containing protein [Armatimonadota bacterium]
MIRRRGFTLIELLVVIAIIAILAAILFPVFSRAREKARQSSCLSNVKQITLGCKMYVQDYDEFFPFALASITERQVGTYFAKYYYGDETRTYYPIWVDVIMPYVMNEQLFRCPSRASDWIGYGYNVYLGYVGGMPTRSGPLYEGVPLADIEKPAEHAMVIDHQDGYWPSYGADYPRWAWYRAWPSLTHPTDATWEPPHNEGANVGCVDGHAKWYRQEQFMWSRYGGRLNWHYDDD